MTTEQHVTVRRVTHWQPTYVNTDSGGEGTYALQLILDNGVAEHVVALSEGEADRLFDWLVTSSEIYFDTEGEAFELFDRQMIVRAPARSGTARAAPSSPLP